MRRAKRTFSSIPACAASALSTDATWTEVRFIHFHFTIKRSLSLTILCDSFTKKTCISIHGVAIESSKICNLFRLHIRCKIPEKSSENLL